MVSELSGKHYHFEFPLSPPFPYGWVSFKPQHVAFPMLFMKFMPLLCFKHMWWCCLLLGASLGDVYGCHLEGDTHMVSPIIALPKDMVM